MFIRLQTRYHVGCPTANRIVIISGTAYKQTQALLLKVVGYGYVENHETEVPFTHLSEIHTSDHNEFLKSNGVGVWLVLSLW